MTRSGHDLLAWRLTAILQKLNWGESLDVGELADEFKVHRRTIQRDLLDRFAFLPIEKVDGRFSLNAAYLGKLTFRDIERFAGLAGLAGLFPSLDKAFFKELFDSRIEATVDIHGPSYENLSNRRDDFRQLQKAIRDNQIICFCYAKEAGAKSVSAAPYRLVNHNGIWYLAAVHHGKPKSYTFSKITRLKVMPETFVPEVEVSRMLDQEDSIWLNEKKVEVVMTVSTEVATYFRRRKIIPQQNIEKELEDGGLIVSGRFAHPNQILPIVRYWIPYVKIVSPEIWQVELDKTLESYLDRKGK